MMKNYKALPKLSGSPRDMQNLTKMVSPRRTSNCYSHLSVFQLLLPVLVFLLLGEKQSQSLWHEKRYIYFCLKFPSRFFSGFFPCCIDTFLH